MVPIRQRMTYSPVDVTYSPVDVMFGLVNAYNHPPSNIPDGVRPYGLFAGGCQCAASLHCVKVFHRIRLGLCAERTTVLPTHGLACSLRCASDRLITCLERNWQCVCARALDLGTKSNGNFI